MKRCPKCGITKPRSDFHVDKSKASGLTSRCKACQSAEKAAAYQANPDLFLGRTSDYAKRNPGKIRAKESRRKPRRLHARHGMWPEELEQLRAEQNNCCYLCERPLPDNSQQVHIDHDHAHCPRDSSCSLCRRGIACQACNTAIGLAGDDPARLRLMAANLERAQEAARQRLASTPEQEQLALI